MARFEVQAGCQPYLGALAAWLGSAKAERTAEQVSGILFRDMMVNLYQRVAKQ